MHRRCHSNRFSFRRFIIMAAAIGRICGARLLKSYGIAGPQVPDIGIHCTLSSYAHFYKISKCLASYQQRLKGRREFRGQPVYFAILVGLGEIPPCFTLWCGCAGSGVQEMCASVHQKLYEQVITYPTLCNKYIENLMETFHCRFVNCRLPLRAGPKTKNWWVRCKCCFVSVLHHIGIWNYKYDFGNFFIEFINWSCACA